MTMTQTAPTAPTAPTPRALAPYQEFAQNARALELTEGSLEQANGLLGTLDVTTVGRSTREAILIARERASQLKLQDAFAFERLTSEDSSLVTAYHIRVSSPEQPEVGLLIGSDGQRTLVQLVSLEAMSVSGSGPVDIYSSNAQEALNAFLRHGDEARFWAAFAGAMRHYVAKATVSWHRDAQDVCLLQAHIALHGGADLRPLAEALIDGMDDAQERQAFVERAHAAAELSFQDQAPDIVGAPCHGAQGIERAEYLGAFFAQADASGVRTVRRAVAHTWLVQLGAREGHRWTLAQLNAFGQLVVVPAVRSSGLGNTAHLIVLARQIAAGTVSPVNPMGYRLG